MSAKTRSERRHRAMTEWLELRPNPYRSGLLTVTVTRVATQPNAEGHTSAHGVTFGAPGPKPFESMKGFRRRLRRQARAALWPRRFAAPPIVKVGAS